MPLRLFQRFENLIDPFRPVPDRMPPGEVLRFYLHHIAQARWVFIALLLVGLVVALVEVALFGFVGRIVDMAQHTAPQRFFAEHGRELAGMAAVTLLLRPVLTLAHDLLVHQAINPGLTSLVRWQNHRYVLRQSLAFFTGDFAGRIANRIMQTGHALRDSAVQSVDALWFVIVYAGSALAMFAHADWRLALPLALWIAGYVGILVYFIPRVKLRAIVASEARSRLMGRIVDGYTNIGTLKLFAHGALEERYAADAVREQTDKAQAAGRLVTLMNLSITSLNGVLITGTCGLALWLWRDALITLGAVTVAVGLVIRINNMSGWIMWVINGIFENIGTVEDGLDSIARPRAVPDAPQAGTLQVSAGGIRFERIAFHYGKGGGVIDGLDLAVQPGERIGLVGPSGAGKSTLVHLLLRLYNLEGGRILIDGQDIAQVSQDSLRRQIGMVTQDTALLHRSIRDNLLYGKPDASEVELHRAIAGARADGFIPQLTDSQGHSGLDALVGERGVKLSGGQRQRIAIARVLLKNAPILILDEATSALDSEAEKAIQDSLETLMQGKTVIAIAHRLSTIARMDRLVVVDGGRIVESGSHAELIARGGLYARLWRHQTGGFVGVDANDAALAPIT
ncbi:ABC transporter ATP-binding protein [Chitinolyticbacter meiyuanensis]|uniref:ABC transporter ATP-binding protein n=1 Tax=Chitinolyticbacter meiyuanensis TaxID=682798 RepID=UPI00248213ED|nr:ABC transporter ATP-binding protein [Chitinolyticbacter meiyuanensis]